MDYRHLYQILETLLRLAALATALLVIWRRPTRLGPVAMVALNVGLVMVVNLITVFPAMGIDYRFFREAGLDALAGRDPYASPGFDAHPILNPPTALPLFAAFACRPERPGLVLWTILNLAALAVLPIYASRVLSRQGDSNDLGGPTILALTMALVASDSSLVGLYIGQLSVLTAIAIVVSLHARASARPILAGVALAVASVKVSTMLPFLLLFSKRSDLRTWVALTVTGLALGLSFGGPAEFPTRMAELVHQIGAMAKPGKTNDYSFQGTEPANMVGFDHTIYRVTLLDRSTISLLQAVCVATMMAWVGWLVLGRRLSGGAAIAMVCLAATLFLYHRNYDLVLLAVPLVHAVGRSRVESGRRRALFAVSATAIVLALYTNLDLMVWMTRNAVHWGLWGRLIQATLLPYVTWSILLAMVTLALGERRGSADL